MEPNTKFLKKPLVYELTKGDKREQKLEKRAFHVLVNGKLVLPHFNILEEAGARSAVEKKISVEVKDKRGIKIEFVPIEGSTILSGISLRKIR